MKSLPPFCIVVYLCVSCSSAKHIYFGAEDRKNFDSSDITIQRKDRLAYVQFFDYKTIIHEAGKMSSHSSLTAFGIFAPYGTKSTYGWSGDFIFSSATDSSLIRYSSFAGDEYKGDYGAVSLGKILGQKRQPTTDRALTVRGTIYQPGDSATFLFFNRDETAFEFLDGYLLHNKDSIAFRYIDSAVNDQNKVLSKKYGNGLFLNEKMLAAIDFQSSPKRVYMAKDLAGKFKNHVAAYLAVAIGNFKIVPRKSTFLKTFW